MYKSKVLKEDRVFCKKSLLFWKRIFPHHGMSCHANFATKDSVSCIPKPSKWTQVINENSSNWMIKAEASSTCAFGHEHFYSVCGKDAWCHQPTFPEIFIYLKADIRLIYKQSTSHLRSKMRQIERFKCESWNLLVLYLLLNR